MNLNPNICEKAVQVRVVGWSRVSHLYVIPQSRAGEVQRGLAYGIDSEGKCEEPSVAAGPLVHRQVAHKRAVDLYHSVDVGLIKRFVGNVCGVLGECGWRRKWIRFPAMKPVALSDASHVQQSRIPAQNDLPGVAGWGVRDVYGNLEIFARLNVSDFWRFHVKECFGGG